MRKREKREKKGVSNLIGLKKVSNLIGLRREIESAGENPISANTLLQREAMSSDGT